MSRYKFEAYVFDSTTYESTSFNSAQLNDIRMLFDTSINRYIIGWTYIASIWERFDYPECYSTIPKCYICTKCEYFETIDDFASSYIEFLL